MKEYIVQVSDNMKNLTFKDEIIRCRDCKWAHITMHDEVKYCDAWSPDEKIYMESDNYCSMAVRLERNNVV